MLLLSSYCPFRNSPALVVAIVVVYGGRIDVIVTFGAVVGYLGL